MGWNLRTLSALAWCFSFAPRVGTTLGWNLRTPSAFRFRSSGVPRVPGASHRSSGVSVSGFGVPGASHRSSGVPGLRRFGFGVRRFSTKQTLAAIFTTQRELCLELSLPSKVSTEAENLLNFGYWTLFYAPVAVMSS
jgi:hypothetical protein